MKADREIYYTNHIGPPRERGKKLTPLKQRQGAQRLSKQNHHPVDAGMNLPPAVGIFSLRPSASPLRTPTSPRRCVMRARKINNGRMLLASHPKLTGVFVSVIMCD